MLNKLKSMLLVLSLFGLLGLVPATAVYAAPKDDACIGIQIVDPSAECDSPVNAEKGFNRIIRRVLNIFSIVIGAVAVIMIIFGGFRYIISGGDSTATKAAKDTILYAVIGLVVVLFAQVIVIFVFSNATTTTPAATPPGSTKPPSTTKPPAGP